MYDNQQIWEKRSINRKQRLQAYISIRHHNSRARKEGTTATFHGSVRLKTLIFIDIKMWINKKRRKSEADKIKKNKDEVKQTKSKQHKDNTKIKYFKTTVIPMIGCVNFVGHNTTAILGAVFHHVEIFGQWIGRISNQKTATTKVNSLFVSIM